MDEAARPMAKGKRTKEASSSRPSNRKRKRADDAAAEHRPFPFWNECTRWWSDGVLPHADRIDWSEFTDISTLGITAGASAPETLVDEVIEAFAQRFEIEVTAHGAGRETIVFNLPRELRVA